MSADGIVNLRKVILFLWLDQSALKPIINYLETVKCPRHDLKWVNLTIPVETFLHHSGFLQKKEITFWNGLGSDRLDTFGL